MASFRLADLIRVWGEVPLCVFTGRNKPELHHVLGRGELFGFGKLDHAERRVMSSVFNAAPLSSDIHKGPLRDTREVRHLLLRLARDRVFNAVGLGEYELADVDRQFLGLAEQWLAQNPC